MTDGPLKKKKEVLLLYFTLFLVDRNNSTAHMSVSMAASSHVLRPQSNCDGII